MQLNNQKSNNNKTNSKFKKKLFFIILSFSIVIILAISFVLLYFVLDIPFYLKIHKTSENNKYFLLAEEAFKNGYLEEAQNYYKSFLSSNPKKLSKIESLERLFEISIVNNKKIDSLDYLNQWQTIDKNNPIIYVNRLKLYLRNNELSKAKIEIDTHYKKFDNIPDYRELVAVYFMKSLQFDKALKELSKIPYNKREFSVNKKIILNYLKLDEISNCIAYISKIEPKIRSLSIKDDKEEFVILKSIAFILKNDFDTAYDELKIGLQSEKYKNLSLKLLLYCDMVLDKKSEIEEIISKNGSEINFDTKFSSIMGDYFIYKDDYKAALYFYEKIKSKKELNQAELMTLSDIYYKLAQYDKSIESIQSLYKNYGYKSPGLYKNLSLNYKKIGDEQGDFFYLKEGVIQYPKDLDFYVRIAKNFIDKNDPNFALQYINDGQNIQKNNPDLDYDKRLDILRIIILQKEKKTSGEKELLNLREKELTTAEYYFKLIEYYLKQKKFTDAKREIETVENLPINQNQKDSLNIYKLIYFHNTGNKSEYEKIKKYVLSINSNENSTIINISIIKILEKDYEEGLNLLNTIKFDKIDLEYKEKIFYLKALIYFYKKDYPTSYKLVQNVLELDSAIKKASYLKTLIDEAYKTD